MADRKTVEEAQEKAAEAAQSGRERLSEALGKDRELEAVLVAGRTHRLQPLGHRLGVAVLAPR